MRFLSVILAWVILCAGFSASACKMEPSVWQRISQVDEPADPGMIAMTDALFQMREKFEREMRAANLASGPMTIIGAWYGSNHESADEERFENLRHAAESVWKDVRCIDLEKMIKSHEDLAEMTKRSVEVGHGYSVTVHFAESRFAAINLIDLNLRYICFLRLVYREETRLFARVLDAGGNTVFVDEFHVSPTFSIDPMITAVGGFVLRYDKNSAWPLMVDFGSETASGGEHVMRVNDAYHQPQETPPMPEFVPDALMHSKEP